MGILTEPLESVRSLVETQKLRRHFRVCELGDQYITEGMPRTLAMEFFRDKLGCGRYESIDGNGRGTVLADLNRPLHKQNVNLGQFDLVTDFGTGEHVFDQAQVFRTIHELVGVGGWFAFDRPCQGYEKHCYWLMNQCVIDDFAGANGYEILDYSYRDMPRGRLLRGTMRKTRGDKFVVPQQGRYEKLLRPITDPAAKVTA